MILVGQFDSPFVRRVAVTLHHYHMPFTRNPLSVFRDVAEMKKINPLVRVPALILESGETLVDPPPSSTASMKWQALHAHSLQPMAPSAARCCRPSCWPPEPMEKAVALFFERLFHTEKTSSKTFEKRMIPQITAGLEKLEHDCGMPWFFDNT